MNHKCGKVSIIKGKSGILCHKQLVFNPFSILSCAPTCVSIYIECISFIFVSCCIATLLYRGAINGTRKKKKTGFYSRDIFSRRFSIHAMLSFNMRNAAVIWMSCHSECGGSEPPFLPRSTGDASLYLSLQNPSCGKGQNHQVTQWVLFIWASVSPSSTHWSPTDL